jgi:hypothetical protein
MNTTGNHNAAEQPFSSSIEVDEMEKAIGGHQTWHAEGSYIDNYYSVPASFWVSAAVGGLPLF